MDGPGLAEALAELAEIDNELSRVSSYANLRESVDVTSRRTRTSRRRSTGRSSRPATPCASSTSSGSRWTRSGPRELYDAPEVARDRHYLVALRRFAPHTLSEPEERMLAERGPAAVSAWQTLFGPHHLDARGALRRRRRRPSRTPSTGCSPTCATPTATCAGARSRRSTTRSGRTRTRSPTSYDTLVGDRLAMDRLRSYASPMEPTHLRNELPGEVVEPDARRGRAATTRSPTAGSGSRPGILGLDRLELHDQYAPIGEFRAVDYPEARRLIDESFGRFSPRVAEIAGGFFDERRVDAEPRAGKRGGAFCAPVSQDASPYILMNFTDRMNDVMTLAHELGHGMHFTLASEQQTALSVGHRDRAGGGALDLRRAARLRPPDGHRDATRRRAGPSCRSGWRARSPRSSARPC